MLNRALIALVFVMGLWSLNHVGRELFGGSGLIFSAKEALSKSSSSRINEELERVFPGGASLFARLDAELPEDAVLLGLHPGAGDADQSKRVEALLLLGEIQLLLFPRDVLPMPIGLAGPWKPDRSSFVPPPAFRSLADAGKLFVIDLGYPYPERIEDFMSPRWATKGGTLWTPR